MKKKFVNFSVNQIKKYYNYSDENVEEIVYGLEVLYITITKTIVIFSLAYSLGLFKPFILLFLFYSLLRLTAFGLHAKESWQCWISSIIIFIGLPYLISVIYIPLELHLIISFMGTLLIYKYSPADTEKRPIINLKRRKVYKIISTLTVTIYIILLIFIKSSVIRNSITFAILLQVIMIIPITYKIFNLSYNNYKNYLANN